MDGEHSPKQGGGEQSVAELLNLGRASRQKGDYEAARVQFQAAHLSDATHQATALELADVLRLLGRLDEAEAHYLRVIDQDPGKTSALIALADIAKRKKEPAVALRWLERAAKTDPHSLYLRISIANVLIVLDRLDAGEERLRSVVQTAPDNAGALTSLAFIAKRRGDSAAALDLYQRAIKSDPRSVPTRMGAAAVLRDLSRPDEAEALYRTIMDLAPGHAGCLMELGNLAASRNDRGAALTWFQRAAEVSPTDLAVQAKLGDALAAMDRFDEATLCFEAILSRMPQHHLGLSGLGTIATRRGNLTEALEHFRAAARSNPSSALIQLQVAITLVKLERGEDARQQYNSIIETWPGHANALIGLGLIERQGHNEVAALAHFEAAASSSSIGIKAQLHMVDSLRLLRRDHEAVGLLGDLEAALGPSDVRVQTAKLQFFCGTLQLERALQCMAVWPCDRDVPDEAVVCAIRLYAALGRWSDVLDFFRTRVVEMGWIGQFENFEEPLVRAARATGRYEDTRDMLDRVLSRLPGAALVCARDQIVEEMSLLCLLDPAKRLFQREFEGNIADPFRARRAEFVARTLTDELDASASGVIYTCADAKFLVGAVVNVFSALRHNTQCSLKSKFIAFLEDNVMELGGAVFDSISRSTGTSIETRASSSLFPSSINLRTSWGSFTPGHSLSQAAYYRIYAARQLIDEGQRGQALYLDADTFVREGLARLLNFDLLGRPIGARYDSLDNPSVRRATEQLGMELGTYFNSGVLLFDLSHPLLRQLLDRTIEIALTEQHRLALVDQCALNLAFQGHHTPLPEAFNDFVRPDVSIDEIAEDSVVIHYLARPKPWDPMYGAPQCMFWLREFAALGGIIGTDLLKRLLAVQYPATGSMV